MIHYNKPLFVTVIVVIISLIFVLSQVWLDTNSSFNYYHGLILDNVPQTRATTPVAVEDVNFSVFEQRASNYTDEEVNSVVESYNPFTYLVNTENPFFITMCPKTGSTQWKALFAFANGSRNYLKDYDSGEFEGVHVDKKFLGHLVGKLSKDMQMDRLQNSSRILITRNPYDRFLSGYLDWLRRHDGITAEDVPFEEFLSMSEKGHFPGYEKGSIPSHHSQSVSFVSNYKKIHYSAILRLEEQDLWYHSFVKEYKLEPYLKKLEEEGTPFYKTVTSMNDTLSTTMEGVVGKSTWKGAYLNADPHVRGSTNKLFDYYTPELADRVFNLYCADFKNFGYPAWNGDPATFRYT